MSPAKLLEPSDASRLSIAQVEAAADELTDNTVCVRHVREIYEQLPENASRATREDPLRTLKINLIPPHLNVTLSGPVEPHDVFEHPGAHQRADVLALYSLPRAGVVRVLDRLIEWQQSRRPPTMRGPDGPSQFLRNVEPNSGSRSYSPPRCGWCS